MNTKLNERMKERAINELLKAKSLDAAARKLGVSSKTLSRWLDDAEFVNAYQEAKRELLRAGIAGLTKRVSLAAETLGEVESTKGGRTKQRERTQQPQSSDSLSMQMRSTIWK